MKDRRSASVSGLPFASSRHEKVPEPRFQNVLDGLGDQRKRRGRAVELDLARLTPARPVSSAPVNPRSVGIAGHDFNQRSGGCELAGDLRYLLLRKEQQPVLLENSLSFSERTESKCALSCDSFSTSLALAALANSGVGASTTARIIRSCSKALSKRVVPLAPIEIRRNQRVDVGVDLEMSSRIEARPHRKDEGEHNVSGAKRVQV